MRYERKQDAPDPLLNEQEAAAYLRVKPSSLQVWRCNKRYALEYVKVGRCIRYRQSALDCFIASRTVAA